MPLRRWNFARCADGSAIFSLDFNASPFTGHRSAGNAPMGRRNKRSHFRLIVKRLASERWESRSFRRKRGLRNFRATRNLHGKNNINSSTIPQSPHAHVTRSPLEEPTKLREHRNPSPTRGNENCHENPWRNKPAKRAQSTAEKREAPGSTHGGPRVKKGVQL